MFASDVAADTSSKDGSTAKASSTWQEWENLKRSQKEGNQVSLNKRETPTLSLRSVSQC